MIKLILIFFSYTISMYQCYNERYMNVCTSTFIVSLGEHQTLKKFFFLISKINKALYIFISINLWDFFNSLYILIKYQVFFSLFVSIAGIIHQDMEKLSLIKQNSILQKYLLFSKIMSASVQQKMVETLTLKYQSKYAEIKLLYTNKFLFNYSYHLSK